MAKLVHKTPYGIGSVEGFTVVDSSKSVEYVLTETLGVNHRFIISGIPAGLGLGQAQGYITGQHTVSGQAQAQMIGRGNGFGQAQAKLNSFGTVQTGQAQAYIYAPLFVQSSANLSDSSLWNNVGNGTSRSTTLPSAVTAGNLLIAVITTQTLPASFTISGSGWREVGENFDSENWMYIYYKIVQPGDSSTVTVTNTSGSDRQYAVMAAEYYGLGSNPVFTNPSFVATGSASSVALPTQTPRDISVAGQAVLFGAADFRISFGNGTWSSWTERTHYDGGAQHVTEIADNIVRNPDGSTAFSQTVTGNGTSSHWLAFDVIITARGPREVAGQSQADIKAITYKFGQAQTYLKTTAYGFGQAQARLYYKLEDDVSNATTITESSGSFIQDISTFTKDTGSLDLGLVNDFHSGWIYIQVNSPSLLHIDTLGSMIDTIVTVYSSGTFDTDDNSGQNHGDGTGYEAGGGSTSWLTIPVLPGTYEIEVSTNTDDPITQTLHFAWSLVPLAAYSQAQAKINAFNVNGFAQAAAAINRAWGTGQAQAYIQIYREYGQAQAFIFHPHGSGQSQADIKVTTSKIGQAQSDIKQTYSDNPAQAQARVIYLGTQVAQAQAEIVYKRWGFGQAQVQIFVPILQAQAQADILQIYSPVAQARPHILRTEQSYAQAQARIIYLGQGLGQATASIVRGSPPGTGADGTVFGPPEYVVVYNGKQMAGYAQSEELTTEEQIANPFATYWDGNESQRIGLKNVTIIMEFLIYGEIHE